jgi:uncharacterized damage-inducible protein DinB
MDVSYRALYAWVRETREILFRYCEAMDPADYTYEVPDLGWSSIRNTHLHVADCYWFWLAKFVGADRPDLRFEAYPDVPAMRQAFAEVDQLVERFLAQFDGQLDSPVSGTVRWQPEPLTVTPRWLLSHTITHEFHHKGQITFLGRLRGHVAPDTDLVLPRLG